MRDLKTECQEDKVVRSRYHVSVIHKHLIEDCIEDLEVISLDQLELQGYFLFLYRFDEIIPLVFLLFLRLLRNRLLLLPEDDRLEQSASI